MSNRASETVPPIFDFPPLPEEFRRLSPKELQERGIGSTLVRGKLVYSVRGERYSAPRMEQQSQEHQFLDPVIRKLSPPEREGLGWKKTGQAPNGLDIWEKDGEKRVDYPPRQSRPQKPPMASYFPHS